jgi:hypothetical protein
MPRKTKKEKIAATQHQRASLSFTEPSVHKQKFQVIPLQPQKHTYSFDHTQAIIKDLKHTLIIAVVIITLEFLFFYANLKGIVSLGH